MPTNGPQQHPDAQRSLEGGQGSSNNQNDNMMSNSQPNTQQNTQPNSYGMPSQNNSMPYNTNYMGQNQPNNQSSFPQNQMHSSQGSFGNGMGSMNNDQRNAQPSNIPTHMMGQQNLPQNQQPIEQRNFQHYQQPMFNQPPAMNASMTQGPSQNLSGSQGEKTYEPGMPYKAPEIASKPSNTDDYPLSPEVMKDFKEKSARGEQYKQTDVFPAVLLKNEEDSLRLIKHLEQKGVSMIAVDTLDQTALFYACRDGKINIVTFLLEKGCQVNHKDQYGQTCIYYASRENHMNVMQKLIAAGADLNSEDMHQQTCLFYAAKQGHIDMCAELINNGANINHMDNKKQTALHWAQKSRKPETVDYLISRGASPISKRNERKRVPVVKKNRNDKREPRKYVLTTFVNGQWLPLSDDDFQRLETECPEVANIIKDRSQLEKIPIPEVPEDATIYDHWEKPAKRIMNNLWKQESAWLFHYPVDVKAWRIEDYYTIVKIPMDFTTIKCKLSNNEYKNIPEFVQDVNQVFDNCILYNGESNQYSIVANKMRREFETQYNQLCLDYYKK